MGTRELTRYRLVGLGGLIILTAVAAFGALGRASAQTVAGVTPGVLSVTGTGAANYSIPITIPPGTAGLEPKLSLDYNSGGGNGLLGMGWSLGGFSVIHRCPATLAQDGFIDGVDFDAKDRFCLDGRRLVAVAGTYGANGTEYRTEIDSFAKIVSYGAAGAGPASFKVWTKSGQILDYGANADSRIEAQGRADVLFWALKWITDSAGNYITYVYVEDTANGEFRPTRIDYTGNAAAGQTPVAPFASVRFVYEARPDVRPLYVAGSLVKSTRRLGALRTYAGSTLVKEYRLSYALGPSTGRSRLVSLTECDGPGACLAPVTFDWQDQQANPTFSPGTVVNLGLGLMTPDHRFEMADVNGDGLQDAVLYDPGNGYAIVNLSNGNGSFGPATTTYLGAYFVPSGSRSDLAFQMADVDGDGWADAVRHDPWYGNVTVNLSQGNGGFGPAVTGFFGSAAVYSGGNDSLLPHRFAMADVNGDGRADTVLYLQRQFQSRPVAMVGLSLGNGSFGLGSESYVGKPIPYVGGEPIPVHRFRMADVNGDGLSDAVLCCVQSNAYTIDWTASVSLSNGNGTFGPVTNSGIASAGWTSDSRFLMADVNGDGRADTVLCSPVTGYAAATLSRGNGGFGPAIQSNLRSSVWNSSPYNRCEMADVNGDGLSDAVLYLPGNGYASVSLARGDGSFGPGTGSYIGNSLIYVDGKLEMADQDGDGLSDLVLALSGNVQINLDNATVPDLLTTITDSLGATTTLTYDPLTDLSVYAKDNDALYPEQDLQAPLYVVSEVSRDDGLGGQARTTYAYGGAKVDLHGRGFLGFGWRASTERLTGIVTTTIYNQGFPFAGRIALRESVLPGTGGDTRLSRLTNTWDSTPLNGGLTAFPHVASSQVERFELNHGPVNVAVTTVVTDATFDTFGNPTRIVATTTGGGKTFVTTTDNTYNNDTAKWFLGQRTRTWVTNKLPDLTTATRFFAFVYNAATGLLVWEAVETGAQRLATSYIHDRFGNRKIVHVAGADIDPRRTLTTYGGDGRFPVERYNPLNHLETRQFDSGFGTLTSLTDPNDLITTWALDGFGRTTREIRPDGTETIWSYDLCSVLPPDQCPAGAVHAMTREDRIAATGAPIGGLVAVYFDILNREIRRETEGFDGTPIFVDTQYNARGQVSATSRPYFQGIAAAAIQWTKTTYDTVGRSVTVTAPDGGVDSVDYDGLTTDAINALGQIETRTKDALGQLLQVTDALGGGTAYSYDHFGNLTRTVDAIGRVMAMDYDIRGRNIATNDPDMGSWTYDYNVLDEVVGQTDAKSLTVTMDYDLLGRMTGRSELEGITTWTFDTALNGIGKLARIDAPGGHIETLSYDGLGRQEQTERTLFGRLYTSSVTYDQAGRIATETYPSGFTVERRYTPGGHLAEVREDLGSTIYWRANEVNAGGQVTEEFLGNGLVTQRTYTPATGLVSSITTWDGMAAVQDSGYEFDFLGNLEVRSNSVEGRYEVFGYDDLNRLTGATLSDGSSAGGAQLGLTGYGYDAIGNLTYKSARGDYDTGAAADLSRTITWSSFNKPVVIAGAMAELTFVHGPDRARTRQTITDFNGGKTITYVGNTYERHEVAGAPAELVHFIRAHRTVAIHTEVADNLAASNKTRYVLRDHLGSVVALSDETGTVVERLAYDPHGARRLWGGGLPSGRPLETPRGFTGHEHLDSVGLIHMNGRVYDPLLGRFLSADPFVQHPKTTQGFNRYSYVNNNPLSFTDPSGFSYGTDEDGNEIDDDGGFEDSVEGLAGYDPDTAVQEILERDPFNGQATSYDGISPFDAVGLGMAGVAGVKGAVAAAKGLKSTVDEVAEALGKAVGKRGKKDPRDELQEITDKVRGKVDNQGKKSLTDPERAAVEKNPDLAPMNRGKAIDRGVRNEVRDKLGDKLDGKPNKGPDFVDKETGRSFDLTTEKAFPEHQNRYGPDLEHIDTGSTPKGWGIDW